MGSLGAFIHNKTQLEAFKKLAATNALEIQIAEPNQKKTMIDMVNNQKQLEVFRKLGEELKIIVLTQYEEDQLVAKEALENMKNNRWLSRKESDKLTAKLITMG